MVDEGIGSTRRALLDSLISDCSVGELRYLKHAAEKAMSAKLAATDRLTNEEEAETFKEERSPQRTAEAGRGKKERDVPEGQHFYAIQGTNELCEIDGNLRQMKAIGKTDFHLSSLVRDARTGTLYAAERGSLLKIDPSQAKVSRMGMLSCGGYPVRNVRGLCFDPSRDRNKAYCLALKGTIRSIKRGDTVCELDMRTGKMKPVVVIELSDVVALVCARTDKWYAWSSYKGLLGVTKTSLLSMSDPPIGISIRSLAMNEDGELFGIGDRLYQIHLSGSDDQERAHVEALTGPLPVSCDGLVCRPRREGFFSPPRPKLNEPLIEPHIVSTTVNTVTTNRRAPRSGGGPRRGVSGVGGAGGGDAPWSPEEWESTPTPKNGRRPVTPANASAHPPSTSSSFRTESRFTFPADAQQRVASSSASSSSSPPTTAAASASRTPGSSTRVRKAVAFVV
eukprot:g1168.t1